MIIYIFIFSSFYIIIGIPCYFDRILKIGGSYHNLDFSYMPYVKRELRDLVGFQIYRDAV